MSEETWESVLRTFVSDLGSRLVRLFEKRQSADYGVFSAIDKNEAVQSLEDTVAICKTVRGYIGLPEKEITFDKT